MPLSKWRTTMIPADWVTGIKDGYETKIIQVGNCTVRVHSPILDDQERARREEQVKDALRALIKKGI